MANLDISEKRRPQDGRIKYKNNGFDIDIRVSSLPTSFGEKIVLRILDKSQLRLDLKKLGLNIGLLFQMTDDLIDFKGNSKIVGKPTKSDKKKGKATLVNLFGYYEALNFTQKLKKKIDKDIKKYGRKSSDLLKSVEFIVKRKF